MTAMSSVQRRAVRHGARDRGFTLVELMVTIAIFAILLGMAAPSISDAMLGSRLTALANRIVASATIARSEAIKRNTAVTMCVSTDGSTCASGGWEQGWIVRAGSEIVHREAAAPAGIRISEASETPQSSLSFSPNGVGASAAVLTVCRGTPAAGPMERVVHIYMTGRTRVEKTTAGTCS